MELETCLARYREEIMGFVQQKDAIWNAAREQALKSLGMATASPASQVAVTITEDQGKAVATTPVDPAVLQAEIMRNLNAGKLLEIEDRADRVQLEKLRPVYMKIYLSEVTGLSVEDGVELKFHSSMSESDQKLFYNQAPSDLIDEIFEVIAERLSMSEQDKAVFGLSTTSGGRAVAAKRSTTVANAESASTTDSATAS